MNLGGSREDILLMTGWLKDFPNKTGFIFKTFKEMKFCTFLHNTLEAQGARADNSNCHILHKLLGIPVTDFRTSRNQKMKLTC